MTEITVMRIEKPDDCRYISLAETLWLNGKRHMDNAARHMAEGRPGYALGSMRKAQRNFARAKKLTFRL